MNKKLSWVSLVSLGLALPALGANTVLMQQGSYQFGSGGEFRATDNGNLNLSLYSPKTGDGLNIWQSFCMEGTENISYGVTYNYVLNTKAMFGSVGAAGDPLSKGTAYLYSQFALGTLANYDYTPSYLASGTPAQQNARKADAGLLQNALWALENESGGAGVTTANNVFYALAVSVFGTEANAKSDAIAGFLGVHVLNMTHPNGSRAQDQLVMVPEPSTYVAAALLMIPVISQVRRMRRSA